MCKANFALLALNWNGHDLASISVDCIQAPDSRGEGGGGESAIPDALSNV